MLLLTAVVMHAQTSLPNSEDDFEKTYQKRIKKEYLNGVYIPKDLTDAFIQLNRLVDEDSKKKFKTVEEQYAAKQLFFSFGRWMIVNWGFYGGSRLSHFIKGIGVHHPEDMARFIMITYHRNLNRQPLEVKSLVQKIQEERQKLENKPKEGGEVLYEETRKRSSDQ